MSDGSKALSVTVEGTPDGWVPTPGYFGEANPAGPTRIVASVPAEDLPRVHAALIGALSAPLGLLYRLKVDRHSERPQASPVRDWVSLELTKSAVMDALEQASLLSYRDARCEIWIRGGLGEQVVLDTDGVLYGYPDDPMFREALDTAGVPEAQVETMAERDYVKHWYHAEGDAQQEALIAALSLQEVPHKR